jgi:hypothetical protein
MPTTTNFSWIMPTVGSDVGSWGTILNTLFGAIDAEVYAAEQSVLNYLKKDGTVAATSRISLKSTEKAVYTITNGSGAYSVDLRLYSAIVVNGTTGNVTITLTNPPTGLQHLDVVVKRSSTTHFVAFVYDSATYMGTTGKWSYTTYVGGAFGSGISTVNVLQAKISLDLVNGSTTPTGFETGFCWALQSNGNFGFFGGGTSDLTSGNVPVILKWQ